MINKSKKLGLAAGLLATTMGGGVAQAADFLRADSDQLFLDQLNETEFMQNIGVNVGGWLSFGGTYNLHNPRSNFNSPVSFNDRHLEAQMNQLNVFFERAVNTEGDSWDIGFRADILFGTDARFTLNADLDDDLLDDDFSRFYRLSFPQIYAEIYAPIMNGVTAKIGHFYTIIGNEVVTSPDNFFYSHAYTMLYGEPFEHNGFLLTTPINDNFTLMAGGVLGWDNFSENLNVWNFLGGVSWSSDDEATGVTVTAVVGPQNDSNNSDENNRWLYSVVATHDFSDSLHFLIQHDHGQEELGNVQAEWYGVAQYLTYDVNDQLSVGLRGEWFRDDDGARVTGNAGDFFSATAGLNYSPLGWLKVRPEVRYDWFDGGNVVFDDGTENGQLTIAADLVVTF